MHWQFEAEAADTKAAVNRRCPASKGYSSLPKPIQASPSLFKGKNKNHFLCAGRSNLNP
jgi:hypothetical protein